MTRVRWFWAGLTTLALAAPAGGQLPSRLEPAQFAALVERLSEPGGFFDTDNLVSNEDSYLHAVSRAAYRRWLHAIVRFHLL